MGNPLKRLTLKGFKSIESLVDFEMRPLNVLIGANGAGKSNFVDFFRLMNAIAAESLPDFVAKRGGGDGFFFLGPKQTPEISIELQTGDLRYQASLALSTTNQMVLTERSSGPPFAGSLRFFATAGGWTVYHFHDTSILAGMRRDHSVRDRDFLRDDASNIAAFLLHLRETRRPSYDLIRETVHSVAPFFDDFLLRPEMKGPAELVRLEWRQKGSDFPFQAHHLSDGTIRFMCLATALLQPEPPSVIVIDEPELGLHPFAITLLAGLIQSAAVRTQVIVSTQSPGLLDHFQPEDVVVVDRDQGRSTFRRLDRAALHEWLNEYSLAELWEKNVLRGGPASE